MTDIKKNKKTRGSKKKYELREKPKGRRKLREREKQEETARQKAKKEHALHLERDRSPFSPEPFPSNDILIPVMKKCLRFESQAGPKNFLSNQPFPWGDGDRKKCLCRQSKGSLSNQPFISGEMRIGRNVCVGRARDHFRTNRSMKGWGN